jgi:NAD(P)-dependent dehydrogenase (short-subunit alcohol dehydrogenase family)
MRILVVGGSGTIGRAVVEALSSRHEVITASRSTPLSVDISLPASIRALYNAVRTVDAVVSTAGQARFAALASLTDEDFAFSLSNKLMGQVNLVRYGLDHVRDGGCVVLTGGVLARTPMQGGAAISAVNAALEGFTRGAALEAPRGIRVNLVSPPWVAETLEAMGRDAAGGLRAAVVARAYVRAVEGSDTGKVIEPSREADE